MFISSVILSETSRSKVIVIEIAILIIFQILFFLIWILFSIFMFLRSPIIITLLILLLRFLIFCIIALYISTWLGLSLFLIFLGGILVIYIFVVNLDNNRKIIFNNTQSLIIMFYTRISTGIIFSGLVTLNKLINFAKERTKLRILINSRTTTLIILISLILIYVLLCSINFTSYFKGALRKTL